MTIKHDDVFYIGDHPLVLQYTDMRPGPGEVGFDIEGVEAMMPLSPTYALWMPCAVTSDQLVGGYETAIQTPDNVRKARARGVRMDAEMEGLLSLAKRIRERDLPLYEAFTLGRPLIVKPENVENLNYLQCAWANSAVYSNRGDFTFAKHVFSRTPQYRELLKARLTEIRSQ